MYPVLYSTKTFFSSSTLYTTSQLNRKKRTKSFFGDSHLLLFRFAYFELPFYKSFCKCVLSVSILDDKKRF